MQDDSWLIQADAVLPTAFCNLVHWHWLEKDSWRECFNGWIAATVVMEVRRFRTPLENILPFKSINLCICDHNFGLSSI
jgi:hypothetical protein